jgi:cytochrome P450 family 26 subfamily A
MKWQDLEEGNVFAHRDFLSVLINKLDDRDQLTANQEIKDNILLLMFAGHDTTSCTLAGVLKYLFLNPQCLQEVIKGTKQVLVKWYIIV